LNLSAEASDSFSSLNEAIVDFKNALKFPVLFIKLSVSSTLWSGALPDKGIANTPSGSAERKVANSLCVYE
jgi:hypothetical protein